jgi:hypothetical protein
MQCIIDPEWQTPAPESDQPQDKTPVQHAAAQAEQ